jgi:hypothetical protein
MDALRQAGSQLDSTGGRAQVAGTWPRTVVTLVFSSRWTLSNVLFYVGTRGFQRREAVAIDLISTLRLDTPALAAVSAVKDAGDFKAKLFRFDVACSLFRSPPCFVSGNRAS